MENSGFALDVSDQVDVHQLGSGVTQLSGSSSTPSSGESTCCSCRRCHGRTSSFSLDGHTFCIKCSGSDCGLDNKCDECMLWSSEEMETYVKLLKSFASKGRHRKSVAKPPSSPGSTAPSITIDFDDRIASRMANLSLSVDNRINVMSEGLLSKFSEMLGQFKIAMSNSSFSAVSAPATACQN